MAAVLHTGFGELPRILIAEPDRDVRALLVLTVRSLGYEPVVYEDGSRINGAVAVVMEPASAGARELLDARREQRPDLPVICLSIYPVDFGLAPSDVSAYLTKPFSARSLAAALRAIGV